MDDTLMLFVVVGGLITLFTFVAATWKLFRFIFKVDRALPTLLNIAHQFESNNGSTLKDKIEQIAERAEEVAIENRVAVKIAEDSRLIANTNASIVNELSRIQGEELSHIREYLHSKLHEVMNSLHKTSLQASLTDKRSSRIEQRLDYIIPYTTRYRENDSTEGEKGAEDKWPKDF